MELVDDMYTDEFYDKLMDRHDAVRIVSRATQALKQEAKDRVAFREWLTPSVKAEFINGEIILHSPVKLGHLDAGGSLYTMLNSYVVLNDLGQVHAEKALVEIGRNDFEPDLSYWHVDLTVGWKDDKMVFPPPTLVIEILSKSTKDRDRGIKFDSYLSERVAEYWIVDPVGKVIEQYTLRIDSSDVAHYDLVDRFHGEHTISCKVIEGFTFPAATAFSKKRSLDWVFALSR